MTAMNHVRSGRRIIQERNATSNPMSAKLANLGVDFITDSLARTSLKEGSNISSDEPVEQQIATLPLSFYHFTHLDESSFHLGGLIEERRSIESTLMQAAEAAVDSLVRAGIVLTSPMQQCLIHCMSRTIKVERHIQARIDSLFDEYTKWKTAFDELMENQNKREYPGRTVLLLRIWFFVSLLTLLLPPFHESIVKFALSTATLFPDLNKLLEGNAKFAEQTLAQDPHFFTKSAEGQEPKVSNSFANSRDCTPFY